MLGLVQILKTLRQVTLATSPVLVDFLFEKVQLVFSPLNSAVTNPERQALAREITPKLTRHRDNISLNPQLFQRIREVYEKRNESGLDGQQIRLVEKYYQDFVRNGANLSPENQERLKTINLELSKLSLQFGENLLAGFYEVILPPPVPHPAAAPATRSRSRATRVEES